MTRVLFVDDVQSILNVAKIMLEREGLEVSTALSPRQALEIIDKERFDAIVSDFRMPGMDGVEFLKTIRERGDNTPFILFTGKGNEEVFIDAFQGGLNSYLPKAGNPESQFKDLSYLIKQNIQRRKSTDDGLQGSEM